MIQRFQPGDLGWIGLSEQGHLEQRLALTVFHLREDRPSGIGQ